MLTVAQLMTHHADRVAPTATLAEAAALMTRSRISSVIVVDHDEVLGIITEHDILHAMRQHRDTSLAITTLMTSPVYTVSADMDMQVAFQNAALRCIRHLVVTDLQGKPLGIVTETDFRRHLGLNFFRQLNTVDTLMEHDFPRLPATATLDCALAEIEARHQSCVIVVDGEQPIGILTERDVVRLFLDSSGDTLLGEAMTHPVATIAVDAPLSDAAQKMLDCKFRHLAVVDRSNQLVGLLTEHSLLRPLELSLIDSALSDRIELSAAQSAAEQAIMHSAQYQQALLDNFPFQVWLKDTESRFLAVNRHLALAAGETSNTAMLGKTDLDYFPSKLAECYRADDAIVMASGEKKTRIEEIVTEQGRCWYETYKAPVHDKGGKLLGTVGFARDISERFRTEEAVTIRNAALAGLLRGERLEGILELLAISAETELPGVLCAILLSSEDGRHLHMGAAPRLSEFEREALGNIAIAEGAGASGTAAFRRQRVIIKDLFSDPKGEKFRDIARAAGITSAWAEPIFSPDGKLLGTFAAYHSTNRTPSPEQEEILRLSSQLAALVITEHRSATRLQASQDTFRGIFDSVDEALIVIDHHGHLLDLNHRAEQLSGHTRGQLLGQTYHCLLADGMNITTELGNHMRAALAGEPQVLELWCKNANGRIFPAEARIRPAKYFGQEAIIASVQDICERKSAIQRIEVERDLADALANGKSRDELSPILLDIALRFPEFDCGGIYFQTADGGYQLLVHRGLSTDFIAAVGLIPAESSSARLVKAGHIVCSCHEGAESFNDLMLIKRPHLAAEGFRCLVVLPIVINGETIACLNLAGRHTSKISHGTYLAMQSLGPRFAQTLLRVAAQAEARQLQQNISGLFDALRDFLFIINPQGIILHYNQAVTELLGYPAGALIGQSIAAVHPAEMQKTVEEMLDGIRTNECPNCALPLLRANGSQLMVEARIVNGYWNGEPAILCLSQDISERLLAEARQKLAASVFDNAHEGIMITDPHGRIIDVNETFTELTGYSRQETIGQSADLLKSGHHEAEFYLEMWETIRTAGYWRGEVWNRKKSGEIFVEQLTISTVRDRQGVVSNFVGIFSDITLIKEHQQRLEHLAHFDALTQLPNRMLLGDRMQLAMAQTERSGKALAVAYLDLDGFKPVNDLYGHSTGDRLLVEVAQRLKGCVRGGDTVSRLGGDEFVLLFSGLADEHECDIAIARVISVLSQPFRIGGHDIGISASIGVTLYPQDSSDSDTLLRHADQAMYAAKEAGRNRHHLFDPENDRRVQMRREEISEIQGALAKKEFALHYQPKVNMRTGKVIGAEALIRWYHPKRGLLLPGQFLHVIEGSQLAIQIGEWVIREALGQIAQWADSGLDLPVSINIAGDHLQHPGFAQYLGELIAAHPNVPPGRLELEVLETAALEDIAMMAELFTECRQLGVTFSLDDFGTGYSSLTYFRRLPADTLKIDQSFVRDMLDDQDDLAIVEGVIGLTQAFKRKVIAEGVETVEHGLALLLLGCDLAQGYGIARPMPAALLPDWIKAFRPDALWSSATAFKWAREDLPLLITESDHLRWTNAIQAYLDTTDETPAPPECDSHSCRFGHWYYGASSQRYATLKGYANIETSHDRLHEIGSRLLALRHAGDLPAITGLRAELDLASRELSECIEQIQAEILITQ